jgi:urease accessory protein
MAVGGFLGLVGVELPGVEIGIALSSIVLGAMVAVDSKPPLWASIALVSVFAVFHGHAHGTELPEDQDGLVYSAGFVLSTGLLHLAGIALGVLDHWERGARILRAVGGLIVSAGAYFLWKATS